MTISFIFFLARGGIGWQLSTLPCYCWAGSGAISRRLPDVAPPRACSARALQPPHCTRRRHCDMPRRTVRASCAAHAFRTLGFFMDGALLSGHRPTGRRHTTPRISLPTCLQPSILSSACLASARCTLFRWLTYLRALLPLTSCHSTLPASSVYSRYARLLFT